MMSIFRILGLAMVCAAAGISIGAAVPAQAADVQVGNLVIENPWTRATPGGAKVGVGYMAIVNIGDKADRLTSASSPIAERVEIHTMSMADGVMRMRKLDDGLELKPQAVTEMKPGGTHLMLIGLKRAIAKGEALPVEVTFAGAGKVQLTFVAASIGATRAPGAETVDHSGGSHSGSASGHASDQAVGSHAGSASGETMQDHKGSH